MKLNKKSLLIDLLVLVTPVIIMILLMPVLPDKIPIHRGISGESYLNRKYSFILGLLPFLIYKTKSSRK